MTFLPTQPEGFFGHVTVKEVKECCGRPPVALHRVERVRKWMGAGRRRREQGRREGEKSEGKGTPYLSHQSKGFLTHVTVRQCCGWLMVTLPRVERVRRAKGTC